MRLLADENFPADAVVALREAGHDVVWIRTDSPGIPDNQVLDQAQRERRIVLTFDKDFGELAFRVGLSAESGIILFRVSPRSPAEFSRIAVDVIGSRQDWTSHFAVVTKNRLRLTPLP